MTREMAYGPHDTAVGALSDRNRGEVAVLGAARNPKLQYQTEVEAAEDAPANSDTGIDVEGALYALLQVVLRNDSSFFMCKVQVDTLDDSQTWTVTLDGVDFDFVGDANTTVPEVINGLAQLIDADPGYNASVNAAEDELTITGVAVDPYTVAVSATGGTAALAIPMIDATEATIRCWYKPIGADTDSDPWLDMEGQEETVERNTGYRLYVGGLSKISGEVVDTDGRTIVGLAPCGLTEQEAASWPTT